MNQLLKRDRSILQASQTLFSLLLVLVITLLGFLTTACAPSEARTAEARTFLNLSLDFLGAYQLPKLKYKDTPVGGLSALTYDRQRDRFYALSDDRSQFAPARFYTLKLNLKPSDTGEIALENVDIENVTFLTDENGATYPKGSLDPEGITLSPKGTVFISSEGIPSQGIATFIQEFDRETGRLQQSLLIPERYFPNNNPKQEQQPQGIQDNLGFESLTFEPISLAAASGDISLSKVVVGKHAAPATRRDEEDQISSSIDGRLSLLGRASSSAGGWTSRLDGWPGMLPARCRSSVPSAVKPHGSPLRGTRVMFLVGTASGSTRLQAWRCAGHGQAPGGWVNCCPW